MDFFYRDEINQLGVLCPPEDYFSTSIECFRWVFEDINDENNFKSQADKNPKILNDKSDLLKCNYYALSFHKTKQDSLNHFNFFFENYKNIYKRLGTHIAVGKIMEEDGLSSDIESNGHFNFHHIKNHCFEKKFVVIEKLF